MRTSKQSSTGNYSFQALGLVVFMLLLANIGWASTFTWVTSGNTQNCRNLAMSADGLSQAYEISDGSQYLVYYASNNYANRTASKDFIVSYSPTFFTGASGVWIGFFGDPIVGNKGLYNFKFGDIAPTFISSIAQASYTTLRSNGTIVAYREVTSPANVTINSTVLANQASSILASDSAGTFIAFKGSDNNVYVYSTGTTPALAYTKAIAGGAATDKPAVSGNGSYLACQTAADVVTLYTLSTGVIVRTFAGNAPVALSADGTLLTCASTIADASMANTYLYKTDGTKVRSIAGSTATELAVSTTGPRIGMVSSAVLAGNTGTHSDVFTWDYAPPTMSFANTSYTATAGVAIPDVAIAITNPDSDVDSLSVTATKKNGTLTLPVSITTTGATRTMSITNGKIAGDEIITVSATDGITTLTQDYTVTVNKATPTITGVTSKAITYGAASIALSGTVSAPNSVYPAAGETVAVTINGTTQNATVSGSTGAFAINNFTTPAIPASGTAYTITYAYAGDSNLNPAANNTSTALTVNRKALTITAQANSKTYDGNTTSATAPLVTVLMNSDTVTDLAWSYDNKNVGGGKRISITAYTVNDGNGGNNYTVNTVANTSGVINQRPITVTAVTDTKVYDDNTTSNKVPTITTGSLANGDSASWTQTFDTKSVGTGKTLTPTGTVSDGNGGNNYAVTFSPVSTGSITVGSLDIAHSTITATPANVDADGDSIITITVTAKDAFGNVIPGAVVLLNATGTGNTLTQPAAVTDISGQASGTLASTVAEVKTVTATINGTHITATANATFDICNFKITKIRNNGGVWTTNISTPNAGELLKAELKGVGFEAGDYVELRQADQPAIAASFITVNSATSITSITCNFYFTHNNAGIWDVYVVKNGSEAGLTHAVTLQGTPPVVVRTTTTAGTAGQSVTSTLLGNGFDSGATVKAVKDATTINATSVTFWGQNRLDFTLDIPSDAPTGNYQLIVTNPDNQSSVNNVKLKIVATTVTLPTITSVAPVKALNNLTACPLTINGTGFNGTPVVQVGSITANIATVSATKITCTVNINGAATGLYDVMVTNADGGTATLPQTLAVVSPQLTNVALTADPTAPRVVGTTITLTATATYDVSLTLDYQFHARYYNTATQIWIDNVIANTTTVDYLWTPTEALNYYVYVIAKDHNSANQVISAELNYPISVPKLTGLTMTMGTNIAGEVLLTANKGGSAVNVEYYFYGYKKVNGAWSSFTIRTYDGIPGNNTVLWTVPAPDAYKLVVLARTIGSTSAYQVASPIYDKTY